ncbi:hypothetical protein FISHEDRAFT_32979 [Fistulina hepatica ATCC 64428]|uniref:Arrestin C-terminal-like domain-containing protein n=1 Tax=Fistulina hepatica ATCC 64428 TaxID=1128425 RepID=A0A0D7APY1_9AGAR|nr:hypothetical protein FISHEDRAFT_32979 [Fistulina hepatica ATCC 64428]
MASSIVPPEDDQLASPAPQLPPETDYKDSRPRLEIILENEVIYLKGTGVDVAPARLAGYVALYLSETASVREITLQFRGKARLPIPAHESTIGLNNSGVTYVVCNHDWSFLEGEKKHSHTLKAGRHLFPFQLQLGGSLPSTVSTTVLGGASVTYKLRAHVTRPGLSHNLQTQCPVVLVRSFTPEALEYQQTLEIENTWPEKIMYSIMIPHKAWAAGDSFAALVKFQPLTKGTAVMNITSSIHETTKIYARSGLQDHTRVVASIRHDIVDGRAVEASEPEHYGRHVHRSSLSHTPRTSPTSSSSPNGNGSFALTSPVAAASSTPIAGPSTSSGIGNGEPDVDQDGYTSTDVVTQLVLPIPLTITPTHGLEPITVSHRIRWSILIHNPDGHTSELRCSLPLHLLSTRLLADARRHTLAARRLLLGGEDAQPEEEDADSELPSYNAHVRDRVANMFLPEAATVTMSVTNSWLSSQMSPIASLTSSGMASPLEEHVLSHLPHQPGSGTNTPLDWVNSELLLSLSRHAPPARTPPEETRSRAASLFTSRRPSVANSPERGGNGTHTPPTSVASQNETYVHSGNASRSLQGLFSTTMRPFTSITHPSGWLSRSGSHTSLVNLNNPSVSFEEDHSTRVLNLFRNSNSDSALYRAFNEVPDYDIASRGFMGGVPPLSSLQGLPSYEQAAVSARGSPERRQGQTDGQSDATIVNAPRRASISVPSTPSMPRRTLPRGLSFSSVNVAQ